MLNEHRTFNNLEILNFQYLEPQHNSRISLFITLSKASFSETM
jgi:hypothetical protein